MAKDSAAPTDLFGDPWTPPRDPRGRKRHKRLPQVAEKVAVLRASGLTVENIATRVGISEPTLRQYYLRELTDGDTLARAVLIEGLWEQAKAGKAAAARIIREEFDKGRAAVPVRRQAAAATSSPAVERLGKKEQANLDAQTAHKGTGWGELLN